MYQIKWNVFSMLVSYSIELCQACEHWQFLNRTLKQLSYSKTSKFELEFTYCKLCVADCKFCLIFSNIKDTSFKIYHLRVYGQCFIRVFPH